MKTKTFALQYTTQQQTGGVGVIVAAAGSAERMGGVNKLFAPLNGAPVLAHTLLAFQNHPLVQCIAVVTKSQSMLQVQQLAEKFKLTKVSDILPGGQTRAESVKIGFDFIQKSGVNTVLIHDGARPLVSEKVISRVIAGVVEFSAAAAAVPVKDAIKQTNSLGKILKNVERSSLCAMQTPQGFRVANYKNALQTAELADFTDDCALMEQAGYPVYIVPGDYKNIKITTPEDLIIAEAFLKGNTKCE